MKAKLGVARSDEIVVATPVSLGSQDDPVGKERFRTSRDHFVAKQIKKLSYYSCI